MASLYQNILANTLAGVANEAPLALECLELVKKYKAKKWLGCGRNRAVFREGCCVVKVPMSDYGVSDNHHEAYLFQRYGKKAGFIPYARCRMLGMLLVMEYVEHIGWRKTDPNWTGFVDGGQVGLNAKGQLLAYDFGLT